MKNDVRKNLRFSRQVGLCFDACIDPDWTADTVLQGATPEF
jgi:hypothetical protein